VDVVGEGDGDARRFELPDEHAEVLLNQDSLNHVTPFARMVVAASQQLPALMQAYREGGGVPWSQFGPDMREGQEYSNRPAFLGLLGQEWLPAVREIHERLTAGPTRVADIGCGGGWSTLAIARAYPQAIVEGFDIDEPSIERARGHAHAWGMADRVRFHTRDLEELDPGSYDLVTAFECIHDMPHPVDVLAAMLRLAGEDGIVMVMDERVAESFSAPADEIERLMYGWSTLVCLPDGMAHPDSVGTGTVMRPAMLERYARAAGFGGVEILPVEHDFWRFYRLRQ
jgi:protein-L-isoaspartate O-methyltransferase